jgi:hypothetical protein
MVDKKDVFVFTPLHRRRQSIDLDKNSGRANRFHRQMGMMIWRALYFLLKH